MNSFFQNIMGGIGTAMHGGMHGGMHHHGSMPPQNNGAPPASSKILDALPKVKVTADDLIEAANRECAVCLEMQEVGGIACKLPCGHLYHTECLREWLVKHCTCPICRFELETDDAAYERERKKRMQSRRLRYRMDELRTKKIIQLQEMCDSLGISRTNCFDKEDLIQCIIASGRIDVTEGAPALEMTEEEFYGKSIRELRELLKSYGLPTENAIEKKDLQQRLLQSNRVIIKSASQPNPSSPSHNISALRGIVSSSDEIICIPLHVSEDQFDSLGFADLRSLYNTLGISSAGLLEARELKRNLIELGFVVVDGAKDCHAQQSSSASVSSSSSSSSSSSASHESFFLCADVLKEMSVREIKSIMQAYNVDSSGCIEKNDMIDRLRQCRHVTVTD